MLSGILMTSRPGRRCHLNIPITQPENQRMRHGTWALGKKGCTLMNRKVMNIENVKIEGN